MMTFVSLFYSPETKDLYLDEVGAFATEPETAQVEPELAGAIAD